MADEAPITSRRSQSMVDVWNKALRRVGITDELEEESDDRLAAKICRGEFGDCLEEALGLHGRDWSFARRQAKLAKLSTSRVGWENTYALPKDCVTPQAILSGGVRYALTPREGRVPYELQAGDEDGTKVLCTDYLLVDGDVLEYTALITAVGVMPALFVSAVAWRLASELALAIPKNPNLSFECSQTYMLVLAQAYAQELNSQTPDADLEPESIRARR